MTLGIDTVPPPPGKGGNEPAPPPSPPVNKTGTIVG